LVVDRGECFGDGKDRAEAPAACGEAKILQLGGGEIRRHSEVDHVGHVQTTQFGGDAAHLVDCARRLDEQRVGTRLAVKRCTLDGGVQSFNCERVSACHDEKILIRPGVDTGLDLGCHLFGRHHRLAGRVTAALGEDLVFDEEPGDAGAFEFLGRTACVGDIAEAGIGINEYRHLHGVADPPVMFGQLDQTELRTVRRGEQ